MSRSYKKTPAGGDSKSKTSKRIANHKVRQQLKRDLMALPNKGNKYKRVYDSWEICDYFNICSWDQYWNYQWKWWYAWRRSYGYPPPDEKEEYQKWLKYYKRK